MARVGILSIAVIAIIAISAHKASALKCWDCNSLMPFCGEIFDNSNLSMEETATLKNCSGLCLKVNNPDERSKTKRMCANKDYAESICKQSTNTFCETCDTDECNGAAEYGPIAALIAIPVAIISTYNIAGF